MRLFIAMLIVVATLQAGTEKILSVPNHFSGWFLVQTCGTATAIYAADRQGLEDVPPFVKSQWIEYGGVHRIEIVESGEGCAKIRLIDTEEVGWVSESLLHPTPEQEKDLEQKRQALVVQRTKQAAEQRKRDAELTRLKAEEEVKSDAERARIRTACSTIYRTTANKRVSDVTVKESQQVQACQILGLYPPR